MRGDHGLPPREQRLNHPDSCPAEPPARVRGRAADFQPTLFGEEEAPAGADGLRILESLQPPPPPGRRRHGSWWAAGGLLAAMLALSAWLLVRHAADAADAPDAAAARAVDTDLVSHQPSSAGRAAPQPAAAASPAVPAPAASVGDAGPDASPLAGAARIEAGTPPAQPSAPATAGAHDPFAGLAPGTAAKAAEPARPVRLARAEPPASTKAQPGGRAADDDVELIEAVVAHGSGRKRVPRPAARTASAGTRGNARDVLYRQAQAEPTAGLLQRCDAAGGLEGVLCRWRICADRWGKDPACPRSSPRPYRDPA